MVLRSLTGLLVVAGSVSEMAWAQGDGDASGRNRLPTLAQSADGAYELPPIDVEGTIPDEIEDTPGAATRFTEEKIDTYRPYTLHDAFKFVPGVRIIDDDVLGRRSAIGIRGSRSRRSRSVLLLEDGVPINGSTYIDPSSHYTPPVERLHAIEVLKGAGHILHGPLNNHGIVNFINQQPTLEPETTLELGYGEDPDTFKRQLMHTRTNGPVGLVFAYNGLSADGVFDVEKTQFDDFFASVDWQLNNNHALSFSGTYFRERSDYDESNLTPIEYDLNPRQKEGRFGQEFNNISVDYWKFHLVHDWQITDALSASTQLFSTDLDRPRFTVDPDEIVVDALPDFVYVDPEREFIPGVSGVMIGRDRHYRTYGAESRFQFTGIETGPLSHTFQWGLRFERHFLTEREPFGDIGEILNEDNRGNYSGENELEEASLIEYQASAISGFFQDALQFGDFTVIPGLRVEHYTQNRHILLGEDASPKEEDDNTLLLPAISILYEGLDETQLFGNVGRGYTPAPARTAEDFPLEPETGVNSQIGFRTSAMPGFSVEGAAFYNIYQNTVVQLPFTLNDQNIILNSEDSKSYGADLGVRFDSADITDSAFNFFSDLAYSYTLAKFTDGDIDGNRVPEVPEHVGSFSLGIEHSSGWHLSGTVEHFGSFFNDPLETEGLILADEDREPVEPGDDLEIREPAVLGEVPSHTIYSARASYTFQRNPDITLWVQGRNLTDKLFIADLENGIRPGPERTVVVGLTAQF